MRDSSLCWRHFFLSLFSLLNLYFPSNSFLAWRFRMVPILFSHRCSSKPRSWPQSSLRRSTLLLVMAHPRPPSSLAKFGKGISDHVRSPFSLPIPARRARRTWRSLISWSQNCQNCHLKLRRGPRGKLSTRGRFGRALAGVWKIFCNNMKEGRIGCIPLFALLSFAYDTQLGD